MNNRCPVDAESEHEVLTSLGDTIVELHDAEEVLYRLMLEGRKRAGEMVAQVTFLRMREQRLRDLLSILRLARNNEPAQCDVCDAEPTASSPG